MEFALKILIVGITIMLTGLGTASMLAPKKMLKNFAIEPVGAAGLNTIRGVIGGMFIGNVVMLGIGLYSGQTLWFLAVGILLGVIAFGRLVGAILDGFDKAIVPPLVVEIVMTSVLVAAHFVPLMHS